MGRPNTTYPAEDEVLSAEKLVDFVLDFAEELRKKLNEIPWGEDE